MTIHLHHARWERHVTMVDLVLEQEYGEYRHVYNILCENGHVDELYEKDYTPATIVELDDRLWNEGSGWGTFQCDACELVHEERCYPGMAIECERCGTIERVPEDAVLESSHIGDIE